MNRPGRMPLSGVDDHTRSTISTAGHTTRGDQGHLILRQLNMPQSELIRAIFLEDSPCCGVPAPASPLLPAAAIASRPSIARPTPMTSDAPPSTIGSSPPRSVRLSMSTTTCRGAATLVTRADTATKWHSIVCSEGAGCEQAVAEGRTDTSWPAWTEAESPFTPGA